MRKILFFGLIILSVVACKQGAQEVIEETTAFDVTTENWPAKSKVNAKTATALKEWPEYVELDQTFEGLYTVENTEDLSLIIEDLIEKQKLMAESVYPATFDKPQVKSRQKVFHTFILKTKGDLEYRMDPQLSVGQMIDAYNALHNQFDIISTNTLDIKKLLEE